MGNAALKHAQQKITAFSEVPAVRSEQHRLQTKANVKPTKTLQTTTYRARMATGREQVALPQQSTLTNSGGIHEAEVNTGVDSAMTLEGTLE